MIGKNFNYYIWKTNKLLKNKKERKLDYEWGLFYQYKTEL